MAGGKMVLRLREGDRGKPYEVELDSPGHSEMAVSKAWVEGENAGRPREARLVLLSVTPSGRVRSSR